jgi:hypothetical protein
MKQSKSKKQVKKGGAAMAVTGAVVGTGAAIAGAMFLKDKKNRTKVKKVFSKFKNKAMSCMEKMEKKSSNSKTKK